MTSRARLLRQYGRLESRFQGLEEEAKSMLDSALDGSGLRIHSVTSRVKEFDSAVAKLKRKGLLDDAAVTGNAFLNLEDMVGLRVVALFRNDLQSIVKTVAGLFADCSVDDKIVDFETSSTGYQSIHVTSCIPNTCSGPRYDNIKDLRFEVQIRTIAADAWASISHHLNYKMEGDVPTEQRGSFRALAGLFYVADTEFQALSDMRQKTLAKLSSVRESELPRLLGQPVTADVLMTYMRSSDLYRGRRETDLEQAQSLAEQLRQAGYERLASVDEAVRRGEESFLEQDERRHPNDKFADVGRIRVSICAVNPEFEALVDGETAE